MRVQDHFFLFDSSYNVNITIGYYDCFGVVREIIESIELLDFVVFIFDIEEVAMGLFDGKDRYFFNFFLEVSGLRDCDASFIVVDCFGVVDGGYGVAKYF